MWVIHKSEFLKRISMAEASLKPTALKRNLSIIDCWNRKPIVFISRLLLFPSLEAKPPYSKSKWGCDPWKVHLSILFFSFFFKMLKIHCNCCIIIVMKAPKNVYPKASLKVNWSLITGVLSLLPSVVLRLVPKEVFFSLTCINICLEPQQFFC